MIVDMNHPNLESATAELIAISEWIDEAPRNIERPTEAASWGRIAKIGEEFGEVITEWIAYTGQNPRKEPHADAYAKTKKELLDVALTALGAWEHLDGNEGAAFPALFDHIRFVHARAGIAEQPATDTHQVKAPNRSPQVADHHDLFHGFCVHGELPGDCTNGGY